MPQNNRLQFSVEESICFQKGQEVSELLSISLDPDISVQEVNDYVSIRGSLELTGEYNIDQTREYAELPATSRFVEDVKLNGDGSAELTHCFPVDITIPKNKVNHLNDVFVFIDAFDYQLTDARMLTIQADLAIEGLLNVSGEADEREKAHTPLDFESAAQAEEELEPVYRAGEREEADSEQEFLINLESPYDNQAGQLYNEAEKADGETGEETVPIYQSFLGHSEREAKPFFTASLSAAERTKRELETQTESHEIRENPKAQTESHEIRENPKAQTESHEIRENPKAQTESHESREDPKAQTESHESREDPKAQTESHESREDPKAQAESHESREDPKAQAESHESPDDAETQLETSGISEDQLETDGNSEGAKVELKREESEEPEPLYRSYTGDEETKETPFFGVPPLLENEEEEREPDSFDIEVTQESAEEEEAGETIEIPEYSFHEQTEPEKEARDEYDEENEADVSAKENDNALYLTKLFTKQGEEEFSRMRMCIVQQNDTIDLLCERYDINAQQLIRMNSLSLDEELKEGQILYIPDYHNSHA
ncbi:LysM peptidoglycan-binding domain-containing protein [Bacillus swezeyi]|uniref:LysM peptidoglycan-binding domain-containing protein n=1 Tax=Bacillus swezeyi TaxID=1925020 RepID=UPI00123AC4CE|nr:LysM peptidoglycan-binding domain-containing protein [Bacillus swezeyi]KAA6481834.1 LysM peptidoglycan-binding domain-containing protein [Bacillus swezeyi]